MEFDAVGDHHLFGIYGPTGSGKTSILDGITYALFGEASGTDRQPAHLRCTASPREYETRAELVFEIGTHRYLIHRRPEQEVAKRRGGGTTTRAHEAHLFDCTNVPAGEVAFPENCGNVLAEKKVSEVAEKVEQLLGYTAGQFRQVVMLPQGQFRVFLGAQSSERSKILRRLFDTSLFERLTDQLKLKRKSVSAQRQEVEQRMAGWLAQADVDDATTLEARMRSLDESLTAMGERLVRAEAAAKQHNDALGEARRLADAFSEAKRANDAVRVFAQREDEIELLRDRIDAAGRAAAVRPAADRRERADREYARVADQVTRTRTIESEARSRQQSAREALAHLDDEEPQRRALSERAAELSRWQKLVAQASGTRAALASARAEAASAASRAEDAARELETAEAAVTEAEQAELAAASAARERAELTEARSRLVSQLEVAQKRATLLNQNDALTESLQRARADREHAAQDHQRASRALEEAADRHYADSAAALSATLAEGEPCPVCGSTHHPKPALQKAGGTEGSELASLRETQARARTALDEAARLVDRLELESAQIAGGLQELASGREIQSLEDDLAEIDTTIAQCESRLHDATERALLLEARRGAREAAQAGAEAARASRSEAGQRQSALEERLATQLEQVDPELRDDKTLEREAREATRAALEAQRRYEQAQADLAAADSDSAAARASAEAARDAQAAAQTEVDEARGEFERALAEAGFKAAAEFERAVVPPEQMGQLQRRVREHEQAYAEARALERAANEAISGRKPPDLGSLAASAARASTDHNALLTEHGAMKATREALGRTLEAVGSSSVKLAELERELAVVAFLADAVDGAGANRQRIPLVDYVLAVYFEQVLENANVRLGRMSRNRYELRRRQAPSGGRGRSGLEIAVYDAHSDDERDTATLSGGEGFLASLALALGLSDVVQAQSGGIKLDSIFIDEGFGHLDAEALDLALDTLLDLAARDGGGRSVGIISHVEDVKRAVPVGFELVPRAAGSSVRLRTTGG